MKWYVITYNTVYDHYEWNGRFVSEHKTYEEALNRKKEDEKSSYVEKVVIVCDIREYLEEKYTIYKWIESWLKELEDE